MAENADLFSRASALAKEAVERLVLQGKRVATAESCTGGLMAKLLTDIPGSSAVFPGAIVSYTNEIKEKLLCVDPRIIERFTEVSGECASAMAEGARSAFESDFALSATGFAGPGGGTAKDPVGTVYLGFANGALVTFERFSAPAGADREQVRYLAAIRALEMLLSTLRP